MVPHQCLINGTEESNRDYQNYGDHINSNNTNHLLSTANDPSASEIKELETRRGRQLRPDQNRLEYQTFQKPPDIVKNIPKADPTGTIPPPIAFNLQFNNQRSRETSLHTLKEESISNTNSKNSSLKSNTSTLKEHLPQRRTSRFRSAFSAYSDEAFVETIAPAHPHIAYQRYQKQQQVNQHLQKDAQNASTSALTRKNQRQSISMDNGIIPAFDDLTMDLGDIQEDNGSIDIDIDNKFSNDSKLNDKPTTSDKSDPNKDEDNKETNDQSSVYQLGRVQQKLFNLKLAAVNEAETKTPNGRFENIEQKIMFESMSNDLRSLRRFNQNPLLSSLKRVHEFTKLSELRPQPSHQTSTSSFVKIHDPLTPIRQLKPPPTFEVPDTSKIEQVLKNATKLLDEIWEEDSVNGNTNISLFKGNSLTKKSVVSSSSMNTTFNLSPTYIAEHREHQRLPEGRAIKEQFEGFKLGNIEGAPAYNTQKPGKASDPSPKTLL